VLLLSSFRDKLRSLQSFRYLLMASRVFDVKYVLKFTCVVCWPHSVRCWPELAAPYLSTRRWHLIYTITDKIVLIHILNMGMQCALNWWCFVSQHGEIYHDNVWVLHPPFGPTLTPQPCSPPPKKKNFLRLSNMKLGNEQCDYVTVNYSMTLKLCTK